MLFLKAEHIVQAWESSGPSLKWGEAWVHSGKGLFGVRKRYSVQLHRRNNFLSGDDTQDPAHLGRVSATELQYQPWERIFHTPNASYYSVGDEQWLQNGQKGFKMLPAQMENFSHSDLVITHCKRILKCYAVARKCAQLCANWNQNHVKNKKTKI